MNFLKCEIPSSSSLNNARYNATEKKQPTVISKTIMDIREIVNSSFINCLVHLYTEIIATSYMCWLFREKRKRK